MDQEPGWAIWTDASMDRPEWSTIYLLADGRYLQTESKCWDDNSLTNRFKFVTAEHLATSLEELAFPVLFDGLDSLARPSDVST